MNHQKVIFEDIDGRTCSIQVSSLATEPAIWIGVDGIPIPRMLLSVDVAKIVLQELKAFVKEATVRTRRKEKGAPLRYKLSVKEAK